MCSLFIDVFNVSNWTNIVICLLKIFVNKIRDSACESFMFLSQKLGHHIIRMKQLGVKLYVLI